MSSAFTVYKLYNHSGHVPTVCHFKIGLIDLCSGSEKGVYLIIYLFIYPDFISTTHSMGPFFFFLVVETVNTLDFLMADLSVYWESCGWLQHVVLVLSSSDFRSFYSSCVCMRL